MAAILGEFQNLKIQLEEIKTATDNFDENKVIGRGGFGKVYEGELSHFKGRSMVAVKRLDSKYGQGDPEFWKEIMMLSRYTHENLISLLGFCDEGSERILVYEHASRGSLDRHLNSSALTWTQRLKICLDAARGLSYLHDDKGTQQRVLHRDVKSSNILLDEKWNAKVSDMGLSKIGPANQQHTALVTLVVGTPGYIDPMYMETQILTKESDTYSFGVVLFEVLCGRLCFHQSSNGGFQSLVRMWKQSYIQKKIDDIIFPDLIMQQMDPTSLEMFADIAFKCLQESREERPMMEHVVQTLEIALEYQQLYGRMTDPKDYKEMMKNVVPPLNYTSEEELKMLLSKGVLLNNRKTWFSLNKNGEHCEMISIVRCLLPIPKESQRSSIHDSRFPVGSYEIDGRSFKTHVRTRLLSPSTTYTVNLVFQFNPRLTNSISTDHYIELKYKLQGEETTWIRYVAYEREDGWLRAELYQFTSDQSIVDLEIVFYSEYEQMILEGIEFEPLEKVNQEVIEEENEKVHMPPISDSDTFWEENLNLPNDYEEILTWSDKNVQWTSNKELYSILCKGFLIHRGKKWFSLNENGKKCYMLPAYAAVESVRKPLVESRFGYVGLMGTTVCVIQCPIDFELLSPQTRYACYLVYKLRKNDKVYEGPLRVLGGRNDSWSIYLSRPQTPIIQPKVDQNTSNPSNRPKIKATPRLRADGWMEVQLWEFQTNTAIEKIFMDLRLLTHNHHHGKDIIVQGIEFKPI